MPDSALPEWYSRRKPVDTKTIDRMVTLMAVDNEFLQKISPLLKSDPQVLGSISGFLPTVIRWITQYYDRYGRAPRAYLTKVFEEKRHEMEEVNGDLIHRFLTRINEEYKTGGFADVDIGYELERAERFVQEQAIAFNDRQARVLLSKGKTREANQVRKNFVLPQLEGREPTSPFQIMAQGAVGMDGFLDSVIEEPQMVVSPWLTDGSLSMLYAVRGIGKTWVCIILATAVTRNNYDNIEVGPWRVKQEAATLYIDGEMPEYYLQDRFRKVSNHFDALGCYSNPAAPLTLLCSSSTSKKFLEQINIADPHWREAIFDYVDKRPEYRLLVFDNVASLAPNLDENSKEAWDPINQWLLSLRHLGVSVIFVHHAGKSGRSRGTSGREDALDNIIQLKKTKLDTIPVDERAGSSIFFDVLFDKARNSDPDLTRPFTMKISSHWRTRQISWRIIERSAAEEDRE